MKVNTTRCITCKNYDKFFNSCDLYYDEVYLGEGEYDLRPVSIKRIARKDCKYETKENDR